MDFKENCERFRELYKDEQKLSGYDLLQDRLNAAQRASVSILAQMLCMTLFEHPYPDEIEATDVRSFTDKLDLSISAALDGSKIQQ
ncbi:hypothetical protein [Roseibium sp. RKSG952]|uniref:hypothetical protein n=1 Tax=Roseibium sp. RKSG952 TaxID=2529384 RepID=UPI0012BC30E8|nr:hypothetical protein [Roseibium sp. RKSG952]MTH95413.1 hypothetical protein [Roseibium sp. RKSG952]